MNVLYIFFLLFHGVSSFQLSPLTSTGLKASSFRVNNSINRVTTIPEVEPSLFSFEATKNDVSLKSAVATNEVELSTTTRQPGRVEAAIRKVGMLTYITSMCIALPLSLLPPALLHRSRVISTTQKEHLSLRAGQFCARWLLRLIPFAKVSAVPSEEAPIREPTVWVCNHISMLDVFFLLAMDKKLRGRKKRPIKIVYWKQLEDNPVTRVLFKMCGFIPIQMVANKPGEGNQYDKASFKSFLKQTKQAFEEGFDIGILPEGQLNPDPEKGLLPVFPGAFTLAKMSRRPIRMMALNGPHRLWHPDKGMQVTGREVKIRAYPIGRKFESSDEFTVTFEKVVGYFGAKGKDEPTWKQWLDGTMWKKAVNKIDEASVV